jgi:hypothetical protein
MQESGRPPPPTTSPPALPIRRRRVWFNLAGMRFWLVTLPLILWITFLIMVFWPGLNFNLEISERFYFRRKYRPGIMDVAVLGAGRVFFQKSYDAAGGFYFTGFKAFDLPNEKIWGYYRSDWIILVGWRK